MSRQQGDAPNWVRNVLDASYMSTRSFDAVVGFGRLAVDVTKRYNGTDIGPT